MSRLRIVVADDNAAWLQAMVDIVGGTHDVVATAIDGTSALSAIRQHGPEAAVLDLEMPGLSGIEVVRELGKNPPAPPVIICSVHQDHGFPEEARHAGARGYVYKTNCARDLPAALRAVAAGETFFPTRK